MGTSRVARRIEDIVMQALERMFPGMSEKSLAHALPMSVFSSLRYSSGTLLEREEVLELLSPERKGLAIYFGVKALHGQGDLQHALLEELATHFITTTSYERCDAILHKYLDNAIFGPLKGPRVPTLFPYTGDDIENRFERLAKQIYHTDAPPALVGYGGLQGFAPFVRHLTPGTEFYVLIPPAFHANQGPYGYKLRKKEGVMSVHDITSPFDFLADRITLVDDFRTESAKGVSIPEYFATHQGWPQIRRERYVVE